MTGRWRNQGERGKTGDHGQSGDIGLTGQTGQAGQQGVAGSQGLVGPRGHNVTLPQLIAFLVLVAAGYLGFDRLEQADEDSKMQREQIQQQQEALCENQRESRDALRGVYRDVAQLGRKIAVGSPRKAELEEVFAQFEADRLGKLKPIPAGCPK